MFHVFSSVLCSDFGALQSLDTINTFYSKSCILLLMFKKVWLVGGRGGGGNFFSITGCPIHITACWMKKNKLFLKILQPSLNAYDYILPGGIHSCEERCWFVRRNNCAA